MTYLDTHAVAALYQGDLSPFSAVALRVIDEEEDLRISPMVLLELEYLREIKRIKVPARRIVDSLAAEIGLKSAMPLSPTSPARRSRSVGPATPSIVSSWRRLACMPPAW